MLILLVGAVLLGAQFGSVVALIAVGICSLLFLFWAVMAVRLYLTSIRCVGMTSRTVTVTGVCEAYAEAVEQARGQLDERDLGQAKDWGNDAPPPISSPPPHSLFDFD